MKRSVVEYSSGSGNGSVTVVLPSEAVLTKMSPARFEKTVRSIRDHFYPLNENLKHGGEYAAKERDKKTLEEIRRWILDSYRVRDLVKG